MRNSILLNRFEAILSCPATFVVTQRSSLNPTLQSIFICAHYGELVHEQKMEEARRPQSLALPSAVSSTTGLAADNAVNQMATGQPNNVLRRNSPPAEDSACVDANQDMHPAGVITAPLAWRTANQGAKTRSARHEVPSGKQLAEEMVQLKLDNWRCRFKVVHTTGQRNLSAFFDMPTCSDGTAGSMTVLDGFKSTWKIRFDDKTPLPVARMSARTCWHGVTRYRPSWKT